MFSYQAYEFEEPFRLQTKIFHNENVHKEWFIEELNEMRGHLKGLIEMSRHEDLSE